MEEESEVFENFKAASNYISLNPGLFNSEQLLYFYARYKQATVGKCNTKKPGLFDFQGKQKWESWNKLADMSKNQAMKEYIQYLAQTVPEWEASTRTNTQTPSGGSWISVSTMQNPDADLPEENKTIFDWCKEGEILRTKSLISDTDVDINAKDDKGMALIHWACDRGNVDMVQTLIDLKADVDAQDEDKQTPLHYAVSCDYIEVVKLLLSSGANSKILDSDGCTPADLEPSKEIQQLLS